MSYLEQHCIKVRALSPVFLGVGESLTKKEYLFIPNSRRIQFIDLKKFSALLESKKQTSAYENFVLGRERDLYRWMVSRNFTQKEIRSVQSYCIDAGNTLDRQSETGSRTKGIQLFIKDPEKRPYIPGSSLKGAIRTAILASMLTDKNNDTRLEIFQRALEKKRKNFKREANDLENEMLNTLKYYNRQGRVVSANDADTSVMKGIQISDGSPLNQNCLTLCEKIDIDTKGNEKRPNIFRECIRPGTVSEHLLTLNTQILAESNLNVSAILNAIRCFSRIQNEFFYSKFPKLSEDDVSPSDGCELYLGGGSGFVSKTLLYPMFHEKALELTAEIMQSHFPKQHHHERDVSLGVSPHMEKYTQYDGKFYRMGRCEIKIS